MRPATRPPGRRAWAWGLLLVLLPTTLPIALPIALPMALLGAVLGGALLPATAWADDTDALRARFLNGDDDVRATVLKGLEGYPTQVGAVLGPVLADRAARQPAAQAAAWLADTAAKDREPLLIDEILRRADGDPSFVQVLRRYLAPAGAGWTQLTAASRKRLLDTTVPLAVRTGAIAYLRHDLTPTTARDLAEAWARGSEDVRIIAAEALSAQLAHRFEDPAAAQAFFAAHAGDPFAEWVRLLSEAKDSPEAPLYRRMVAEARANLEHATTLAEVERYLRVSETPWPEVRRLAAGRAPKVETPPDAWIPVLRRAIDEETDRETLVALLEVTPSIKRGGNEEALRALGEAALARMPACCGDPELLRGLLSVLGRVGDPGMVSRAYEAIGTVNDPGALETWLAVAGDVGGNELSLCEFHRARADRTDEATVALRRRAIDALARGGGQGSWSGSAVASAYLRGILRRTDAHADEARLPKEMAPEPRMAAVRGLEAFPSPESVARLRELVRVPPEDVALARLAVSVLAKLAASLPDAAEALVDVAQSEGAPAVRIEAVRDLARLAAQADDDVRRAAIEAVRSALRPTAGNLELRLAAAEAAAALLDDGSLPGVFALAAQSAKPDGPRLDDALARAVEGLVTGLAKADARNDPAILDGLRRLAAAGGLDPAVALADAAADAAGGRLALQVERASLRQARAARAGREAGAARQDLQDAHRILRSLVVARKAAPTTAPADPALWTEILRRHQDVAEALLTDESVTNGSRRSALLSAVEAVVLREDATKAAKASGWLAQASALPDLSADEKAALERWDAELSRLLHPNPPPK